MTETSETLGAGKFTVGRDLRGGVYDVSPGAGQSGVIFIEPSSSRSTYAVLEVLGGTSGVPRVRVDVSEGDTVSIRSLAQVTFVPVALRAMTHGTTSLHTGIWSVGEDVSPGRYVVTPEAGQHGTFFASDGRGDANSKANAILGGSDGVASITVNLNIGDLIKVSGLSQVTLTPA